ncbi:ATP-binding cassette, subfamily B [Dyadobacter koreensis]|uniref:Multidrug resistance-like ATP-binding protein MdlB n=1 Tax=Dyadobacter koreensis TaxID=408657 RepID=A0A1H7AWA4_9BACT|nr:peptidase domain-containing ABC transporter [Dyadobacter koreensis]SEJ69869.1 ATP-binding cassette, subfamily B [Dyadobacter koreensis]
MSVRFKDLKKYSFIKQRDEKDCGPTCLKNIFKSFGKNFSIQLLRDRCGINRQGASLVGLSAAAESLECRTLITRISFNKLSAVSLPVIVKWNDHHFVVVYQISKGRVIVSDPAFGKVVHSKADFLSDWAAADGLGTVLMIEPTPKFFQLESVKDGLSLKYFFSYFFSQKKHLYQVLFGGLSTLLLQFLLPFLTQSVVDVGIKNQDLSFIQLIFIAQIVLFLSRTAIDFIRGWIFLYMGGKIGLAILTDFLIKLTSLPISFFNVKTIGDLFQRIGDHRRIESFISSATVGSFFSFLNLIVFGAVLAMYSMHIFAIFFAGSALYLAWVLPFMKSRKALDYKSFKTNSDNQNSLYQLITGIQEIKLNNIEREKRWDWERSQLLVLNNTAKSLRLIQYQQIGGGIINEFKNLIISYIAAKQVVDGDISLGMMISIQYMIGQLNVPISQMISLLQSYQDAKISMDRLNEIHMHASEPSNEFQLQKIPKKGDLTICNLDFSFDANLQNKVLADVSFVIPRNKITAIVGGSGSGKTSLLKLILKFYEPNSGSIKIGDINLENIDIKAWRNSCGVVLQDSFIFSDTLIYNITLTDEVDHELLNRILEFTNIKEFLSTLQYGMKTKIGSGGHSLSQGQRQRILIARALYKNPDFLFLDEATNALDSTNEAIVIDSLKNEFKANTIIMVAHRLSTVRYADQIIVLDSGRIVESGTHDSLMTEMGNYYQLFLNQTK